MLAAITAALALAVCPTPDSINGGKGTIDPAPYSYDVSELTVVVGTPSGYAPAGVVYKYWRDC